jgi:hypothetical protein
VLVLLDLGKNGAGFCSCRAAGDPAPGLHYGRRSRRDASGTFGRRQSGSWVTGPLELLLLLVFFFRDKLSALQCRLVCGDLGLGLGLVAL